MNDGNQTDEALRTRTIRELGELVAALDRRVPQVERVGEAAIARSAAALKAAAVTRIEELEQAEPVPDQRSSHSTNDPGPISRTIITR